MIPALILGRKSSKGFPGKNTFPINGRPLAWYPMKIAKDLSEIDKVYLSTDDPALMDIAKSVGVNIIERPDYLCSDTALGDLTNIQADANTASCDLEMLIASV